LECEQTPPFPDTSCAEKQPLLCTPTETNTLSHSHLPVQHLLKQVELYRSNRNNRDVRPEWLTRFIDRTAELFDPAADVARVGFDCRLDEDGWEVNLFLGSTEIVGGKEDGHTRHCNFEFDLSALVDQFDEIERFSWNAIPEAQNGGVCPHSFVTLTGVVAKSFLRIRIHSVPPAEVGPGLREFPNGKRESV
jgi:hypothetical protein